jgi:transglutaminase-like putative cysteine protease
MKLRLAMGTALLIGFAATIGFADAPAPSSRSFDFSYVVKFTPPSGSRAVKLWVPVPHSDEFQTISNLKLDLPTGYKLSKDLKYGDQYAYVALTGAQASAPVNIAINFRATRLERRVDLANATDPPGAFPAAVQPYLQPDKLVPINGRIGELSREQTAGLTDPMQKARKIYEYVISVMHYDHDGTGWGRGDAIWACDAKHGNCTDFHSVFIGMTRAAGIPARFEIGFPLPEDQSSASIPGYHCWAEFYLNGVGWIPIDASEAWQNPKKHDYFFGAIDANRVMFSAGRDIAVTPAPAAGPLNFIVYPYVEIDGKAFTTYEKTFSFKDAPALQ